MKKKRSSYHEKAQKFIKSSKSLGYSVKAEGSELIAYPKNGVKRRGFFGFGGSKSTPKPQGNALKGGLGAAFGSKMGSLMHPGNISLRKLKRGMAGHKK